MPSVPSDGARQTFVLQIVLQILHPEDAGDHGKGGTMMKTMAQFKRDAASGKMSLELLERNGSADFPDRLKGVRKVTKANSVEITLVNQKGEGSCMRLGRASLMEYDGDSLVMYNPGYRDLTEQETAILAEGQRIRAEYEQRNPYGNAYWTMKDYFKNCPCPWLAGFGTVRGKQLVYGRDEKKLIRDSDVKGDAVLKYHVYMET